jgi:hypothetical protein
VGVLIRIFLFCYFFLNLQRYVGVDENCQFQNQDVVAKIQNWTYVCQLFLLVLLIFFKKRLFQQAVAMKLKCKLD